MGGRRIQIVLDEPRYEQLRSHARIRGMSVGAIVREVLERAFAEDDARRWAAGEALLSAEPMPVPDDPQDLKREIEEARLARWQ